MASYTLVLTPTLINRASEGYLDTTVTNGVSLQRTAYLDVFNSTNRKIVRPGDGDVFTDTISTWSSQTFIEPISED